MDMATIDQIVSWAASGIVAAASGLVVQHIRKLVRKIERFTEVVTKVQIESNHHKHDIAEMKIRHEDLSDKLNSLSNMSIVQSKGLDRIEEVLKSLPCIQPKCKD